jgi:hypothetical protein
LLTVSRSFMNVANSVFWRMVIILKTNKVNSFVSSVLVVFWYQSPNLLDTPRIPWYLCTVPQFWRRYGIIITYKVVWFIYIYDLALFLRLKSELSTQFINKEYQVNNFEQ